MSKGRCAEKRSDNGVNTARLRLLSLEKFVCKVSCWLASGNLTLRMSVPNQQLTNKNGSLCLNCANSVAYAEHVLSFWKSGTLVNARQRMPTWPVSDKNVGHQVSNELSSYTYFACVPTACCCRNWACPLFPLGEDSCKCVPGFSKLHSVCLFLLLNLLCTLLL